MTDIDIGQSVTHESTCAGVYFVPAFSGLLAPHWRDDARGALLGVSSVTSRAHIVRAMLEAICWQARPLLPSAIAR